MVATFGIKTALAIGALALSSQPAFAHNESTDLDTDLQRALDEAEAASPLGAEDKEFRALFASWRALDQDSKAVGAVSIPSRMPVDHIRLTSDFGLRNHPISGRRAAHKGVDLAGPIGTPIYATADGVVSMAQRYGGYGNYVQIEHGGEIQTRYGHMSALNVREHQKVKRGDLIGFMGSTGRSTGSHLHYEVRVNGDAVNPVPFMQGEEYLLAMQERYGEEAKGGPED